jgi:hypothetical protein
VCILVVVLLVIGCGVGLHFVNKKYKLVNGKLVKREDLPVEYKNGEEIRRIERIESPGLGAEPSPEMRITPVNYNLFNNFQFNTNYRMPSSRRKKQKESMEAHLKSVIASSLNSS